MQCAARSIPPQRSFPARRWSISLEPTPSVVAASSLWSSSGNSPAKWPKPEAPVASTAARRRSTTASAVASETPADSYVRPFSPKRPSLRPDSDLPQPRSVGVGVLDDDVRDRLRIDLLEVAPLAGEVPSCVPLAGVLH